MSLKELEAKIQWAREEAWYKGNVDAFDEVYAADYCMAHSRLSRMQTG